MKAYLYCDPRSLNDATRYYVNIIRKCVCRRGFDFETVHKLSEIKHPDLIITVTERYFLLAKLRFAKTRTIYWSQGVTAEEAKNVVTGLKSRARYLFRRMAEPVAVNKSSILFCVSDRMVEYYKEKYGLKDRGQIVVMPCYNLQPAGHGSPDRYARPTFVYAGNASSWQCADVMLDVYRNVEQSIPDAELVIFSNCADEFESKIRERGIRNYSIRYVSVEQLQEEMLNYKYGFVIRDKHIINQVATPTKLNSYLASYLIPVFSDGVAAFAENIDLGEFTIMAKCPLDAGKIAGQIVEFENSKHDFNKYPQCVDKIFREYFNDSVYEEQLDRHLESLFADR